MLRDDFVLKFPQLKRYYEIRTLYREDFADFYPTRLKATLNSGIFMVLKHRDPYGRKILLFKTGIHTRKIYMDFCTNK